MKIWLYMGWGIELLVVLVVFDIGSIFITTGRSSCYTFLRCTFPVKYSTYPPGPGKLSWMRKQGDKVHLLPPHSDFPDPSLNVQDDYCSNRLMWQMKLFRTQAGIFLIMIVDVILFSFSHGPGIGRELIHVIPGPDRESRNKYYSFTIYHLPFMFH